MARGVIFAHPGPTQTGRDYAWIASDCPKACCFCCCSYMPLGITECLGCKAPWLYLASNLLPLVMRTVTVPSPRRSVLGARRRHLGPEANSRLLNRASPSSSDWHDLAALASGMSVLRLGLSCLLPTMCHPPMTCRLRPPGSRHPLVRSVRRFARRVRRALSLPLLVDLLCPRRR